MKFVFKDGLIWIFIDLIYEGKMLRIDNCLLDTGSATTAFDIDLVNFNYKKPAAIKRLCGLGGGTQEVICQNIDALFINEAKFKDIEIEFGDIRSDFGICGFIGNDILSRFAVKIDFSREEIVFYS